MSDLTVIYDEDGPIPRSPAELRAALVAKAIALAPGITTELPGSLVEDLTSTATGALVIAEQARIDTVNSVGPLSANLTMLDSLAQQAGIPAKQTSGSTTVSLTFSGSAKFLVPAGFVVSDGQYQYATEKAVTIRSTGTAPVVTAKAVTGGSWPVLVNTVTTVVTAVPAGITLTVTNLVAGTAASDAESNVQFRARVWDANMFTVQGYPGAIRTALTSVENVDVRQVSVVTNGNYWTVMAGGGDTVDQASAIFNSAGDITRIVGSTLSVTGITNANPGVVTTDLTHGFSTGQVINIAGVVGMTGINNTALTIKVIDANSFSIGINTTSVGSWQSGGVVTPNLRNVSVTINDWPNSYTVRYVQPLQQLIGVTFGWQTQSISYLSDTLLLALVQNNIIKYVNSIYAGQPLNINKLKDIFLQSINDTVDMTLITALTVSVVVNGVLTPVNANTNIISGDKFSYWYIPETGVSVVEI